MRVIQNPSSNHPKIRTTDLLLGALLGLLFLVPLAIFLYTGYYNRLMVDDYMTLNALRANGFWGSQAYWYLGWSGRFSFTFLMNLVELGGTLAFPYIPGLVLFLWLAAAGWACSEILALLKAPHPRLIAAFAALAILCLTLMIVPNIYQVAFWVTGVLTYEIPLAFSALILAIILREYRLRPEQAARPAALTGLFLLALVGGAFSETSLVLQVCWTGLSFLCALFLVPRNKRGPLVRLTLAALAGSLLSLALVGAAPGNEVRASATPHKGWWWAIGATWQSVSFYIIKALLVRKRLQFLVALVAALAFSFLFVDIPALRGFRLSVKNVLLLGVLPYLGVLALAYLCYYPAYLILSNGPPERATVIGMSLEAGLWIAWGLLGGQILRQWVQPHLRDRAFQISSRLLVLATIAALLALLVPRYQGFVTIAREAHDYAQAWDARDAYIRQSIQAGERDLVVDELWREGDMSDLTTDPDFQMNRVIAEYYGVESIIAQ